jgi:hypothetical protein
MGTGKRSYASCPVDSSSGRPRDAARPGRQLSECVREPGARPVGNAWRCDQALRQDRQEHPACIGASQAVLGPDGPNLGVRRKLPARRSGFGSRQRRVLFRGQLDDRLLCTRELKNDSREVILHRGRQALCGLEGLFQQLRHGGMISIFCAHGKGFSASRLDRCLVAQKLICTRPKLIGMAAARGRERRRGGQRAWERSAT